MHRQAHLGSSCCLVLALTYGRYSTDAEGRRCGREGELIQYCVGPSWINHCNVTAGGRARNYPHRTLTEKVEYDVWRDDWHETTCSWVVVSYGWIVFYMVIRDLLQSLFN